MGKPDVNPDELPMTSEPSAVRRRLDAVRHAFRLTNRRLLAIYLVGILSFLALGYRTQHNGELLRDTQQRLAQTQTDLSRLVYRQCLERNVASQRSNAVLQSAIDAETRNPKPDTIRIRALQEFKQAVPDCGHAPAPVKPAETP